MAQINSRLLFLTTSPRTPAKMLPEIGLLAERFSGQPWNAKTQRAFMGVLREEQYFNGHGVNDPAFSARDRINRAPKSLGLVTLSPVVALTDAGRCLLQAKRKEEPFLRQLLKFQIPSPYHKPTERAASFCVKPYLELLRLVRTMGTLRFDELQIFGMQLTDWHLFDGIVEKIERFRKDKLVSQGSYREFKSETLRHELMAIYADRISQGNTRTRESHDASPEKFLRTQASNMRDYADACFRYLRSTGLLNVSHVGKSLSIVPGRKEDVDSILQTVNREPCFVDDEKAYAAYLGDPALPLLPTDNRQTLIGRLQKEFNVVEPLDALGLDGLKELFADNMEMRKQEALAVQVKEIKDCKLYDDIQGTFDRIEANRLYDAPLMLEWNVWRAMTMLDGGDIKANLHFDDFGHSLSTAQGNRADIVCDYGDYLLTVEVTMQTGQTQYENEGEPVSRHLGKLKKETGKPCYCLFVAPKINEASVAHFFGLHKLNISYYGGKSAIVPLPLDIFRKMLEDSYKSSYTPSPQHVRRLFQRSEEIASRCDNESLWYEAMKTEAMNWLN